MVECLERMETQGSEALEDLCRLHPEQASALRRRIRVLASVGLLHAGGETVPEVIGPYRILGRIGHGGMGVVYRAQRADDGATVALKLVRGELLLTSDNLRRRFEREVQAVSCMASEHVVRLFDHGEHGR